MEIPAAGRMAVRIASFQRVPEHLAQGRGIGTERRLHAGGQRPRRQTVQLFQDPGSPPVKLHVVLENHVDRREPEHRVGPHRFHTRHAQQRHGQRVRDLVLDILRRSPHPFGEHDLLVLADVRNRIDRHRIARQPAEVPVKRSHPDTPGHQQDQEQDHNQLVLQAKPDGPAQ